MGSHHYLVLSLILFAVGIIGVLTRRNVIIILMSIELMLNAANLNFIVFSRELATLSGHVFAVFTITVAAAEVAVGLAILIALYRNRGTVDVTEIQIMKW